MPQVRNHLELASSVLDIEDLCDELIINVVDHQVPGAGHHSPGRAPVSLHGAPVTNPVQSLWQRVSADNLHEGWQNVNSMEHLTVLPSE